MGVIRQQQRPLGDAHRQRTPEGGTLDGFDRMHRYLRVAASLPKSAVAATPQQASLNPRG